MHWRNLLFGFVLFLTTLSAVAQSDTTVSFEVTNALFRPNVVKYNPTPSWVWDASSLMFSYERVLKPHQSAAISFGYLRLPGLIKERKADTASFSFERARANGYSLILEYRFYLPSENKHFAPRGFFVAPYLSHHNHWWKSEASVVFESGEYFGADINSHLVVLGMGAQLGYQFHFLKDRLTLDLITFAPSYTFYELNLGADSNSSVDLSEYYPQLAEWLLDKYPWLSSLTEEQLVNFKGHANAFNAGVRFVIQVGYRF